MRMLVVDDDRMICAGTARRIVRMGMEEIEAVECAHSGEEALEMMRQRRFDAMFTDIRMAEMDGLRLVREAKAINPNLICVVITAFDRFQYAQEAIRLGVEDFLVKPLSEPSMRRYVENVLAKYRDITAQKELRLELEICAQLLSGELDLDECFQRCGLQPPQCEVCMAVWQGGVPDQPLPKSDGLWRWSPRSGRFLLIAWEPEKTLRALNGVAQGMSRFAGVSVPGRDLKRMVDQAEAALAFAWSEEKPCAVRWTAQRTDGFLGLRRNLLAQVRALNEVEVRRMLEDALCALSDDLRMEARQLIEAVDAEVGELCAGIGLKDVERLTLLPGTGVRAVLQTLTNGIEAVRRAESNMEQLDPVAYAKHYALTHLYEPVDMAVLANQLNLSYAYFSRIFREQAGTTFTRYLLSLRMQEVCKLLLNGEKLVEIAEKLCYQNAANLTRSFTREFGMSPSRWLEKQKAQGK